MLDADLLNGDVQAQIDDLIAEIESKVLSQNIPFLADLLSTETADLLAALETLKTDIDTALAGLGEIALEEIVERINSIDFLGDDDLIKAGLDAGNIDLAIELSEKITLSGLGLDTGGSLGLVVGTFDFDGDLALDLELDVNFALSVDGTTGDVTFDPDAVADEVSLNILGEIDFEASTGDALGFLAVDLEDNEVNDPLAPKDDLELSIGLDLQSGGADPLVSLTGRATLDVVVMASSPAIPILPEFGANVFVEVTYVDADLLNGDAAVGDMTLELRDVVLKLEALADVLQRVFSTVSDIVDTFPIGEIVDIMVQRLPVIDDLAPSAFDFDSDGKITMQDVITFISIVSSDGLPPAFGFIQGVVKLAEVIQAVETLAEGLEEDGCFDIGTLRLTSDAISTIASGGVFGDGDSIIASEDSDLANLADLIAAFGDFTDFIGLDDEEAPASASAPATASLLAADETTASAEAAGPFDVEDVGLSFPFLDSPEALIQALGSFLLNGAGTPAVSLVEFDLPELSFDVFHEIGIRFGPFIGYLRGTFYAGVDISVGYDTAGFAGDFNFEEGFYISPDLPEVTVGEGPDAETKQPVGSIALGVGVGGGVDVVIARVAVEGGLLGQIDVFLGGTGPGDNKARLSDLGLCFFDDIAGRITAGIDVVFKFGFGFFSFEKRQSIASVTLAQFNIDPCNPPPTEIMEELEVENAGLAEDDGAGLLTLNVGSRASNRTLPDAADAELDSNGNRIGKAETETFFVGQVPEDEDNPAGPNEVAVFAFGVFERYGTDAPLTKIVGNGGSKDDTLTVAASITIDAELSGGDGRDILIGGGGNDLLQGNNHNDQLDGDEGDDDLRGGGGNDILRGGEGADDIDGGAGDLDQVDFSTSNQGVFLIESASTPGLLLGSGGEAQGDTVRNVEHFIGSNFSDIFYGNRSVRNVFEANAGDDVLIGGSEGDLFIGGMGADIMRGNRAGLTDTAGDAASYVFSGSGVIINVAANQAFGGEAQGDRFYGIEDFQLSRFADTFIGDDKDNLIDGYDGDDTLDGAGGADEINAGLGDDIVFGRAQGDTLDGGGFTNYLAGQDLLTYERADGGVVASLLAGIAFKLTTPIDQDDIRFAQTIQFNTDAPNEIVDRDPGLTPVISSFEDLTGSEFNDVLTGDDRGNEIRGGAGDDDINGAGGNDILIGEEGADDLDGGDGLDTADYKDSNAGVSANLTGLGFGGHAEGDSYTNVENLVGSRYLDTLVGDAGDNRLDAYKNVFSGTEILAGNGGTDTAVLNYSDDNSLDTYFLSLDELGNGLLRSIVSGGATSDLVNLSSIERVELFTAAGADFVSSQAGGNDLVNTAGGNDTIGVGIGYDRVYAGVGDDTVVRLAPTSIVDGRLLGAGDDLKQAFILDGGRGIDSLAIDISYVTENITLFNDVPDGLESDQRVTVDGGGVFKNFELFTGLFTGSGDDVVGQLGDVNTVFSTGAGADVVTTGFGSDVAEGGESGIPDPLFGVQIEDLDILIVDYSTAVEGSMIVESPDANGVYDGIIRLESALGSTLAQVSHLDFERGFFTGTDRNDIIIGLDETPFTGFFADPAPGDILEGGDGDDQISGLAGNDILRGGEGSDILRGGDGDDVLLGAFAGGDEEQDQLEGGAGADRFVIGNLFGLYYNGVEDLAGITDFSRDEGDVIVLHGSADEYVVQNFILGSGVLAYIFTKNAAGEADRLVVAIQSDSSISLTGDYIEYQDFVLPPPFDPFALSSEESDIALVSALETEVTDIPELAVPLWQAGVLSDDELMQTLKADGPQPDQQALSLASAAGSAQIVAEEAGLTATEIINDAISAFAIPLLELDTFTFYTSVEITGDAAASGTFTNFLGHEGGLVLSTGRVEDIHGPNTEDGRYVIGPRPAFEQVLTIETLGALENGTLYRAELPDVPGGIASFAIRDDGDLTGGASGRFSAFDLDAVFFSDVLLTTTTGLTRADLNSTARLDVIDYSADGLLFDPGYQRPGSAQAADFFGAVNGMVDVGEARLDIADWNGLTSSAAAGALSLGEGGALGLNLTTPLSSPSDAPTYVYIYEIGAPENLEGVVSVSSEEIGVAGDLSTDLGAPGLEGDTTTLTATFQVDFSGQSEQTPSFAEYGEVEFFEVVIVSEELPERGGAELPDLVSVRINGVDVLRDGDGNTVTMNSLALTPYGDYAPELTLNLLDGGPLLSELRADAFTTSYVISGPVIDGQNTIEVKVADQSDALLDTAIFIAPLSAPSSGNSAPVARNDIMRLDEDSGSAINVITGDGLDTDVDGDALSVTSLMLMDADGTALQTIALNTATDLVTGQGSVFMSSDGTFGFESAGYNEALAADEFAALSFGYQVSDGQASADGQISVVIDGLDEPNDAPEFTTPKDFIVDENTNDGVQIAASDADGPLALTYGLLNGGDAGLFDIDPVTGLLRFVNTPDHEDPLDQDQDNFYEMSVSAFDGVNTSIQSVTVEVANVEEICDGLNPVEGTDLGEELEVTEEADCVTSRDGADVIFGTLSNFDGDVIHDFSTLDALVLVDIRLAPEQVKIEDGPTVLSFDADGDGTADASVTLVGSFAGDTFEVSSDGVNTTIRLAEDDAIELTDFDDRFVTTDPAANKVYGGSGNDVILTGDGNDLQSGGDGEDSLIGGADADLLIGGLGSDRKTGGAGADEFAFDVADFAPGGFTADFILDFTPGEDAITLTGFGVSAFSELEFQTLPTGDAINLGANRFIVLEGITRDQLSDGDFNFGTSGQSYGLISTDTTYPLTGDDDSFVTTDPGMNEVDGGFGNDILLGGDGIDLLQGGPGEDFLVGGRDDDILIGGQGADRATGLEGADQFLFSAGEETGFAAEFITDFEVGQDQVVLIGFGLDEASLEFQVLPGDQLALSLSATRFIVFEGYSNAEQLGALEDAFVFF